MRRSKAYRSILVLLTMVSIAPFGAQGEPKKSEPTSAAPVGTPGIKMSKLVVESVGVKPVPTVQGNAVDLIVTFKNKGLAESNAETKYTISCVVKSGGPACPVPNVTRPVNKAVAAGQTHQVTLAGAGGAAVGVYDVNVKVEGEASGITATINVTSGVQLKPKKKAPAAVQ